MSDQASKQMVRGFNPGTVTLRVKIPIAGSGATGTIVGKGVTAVAKNTTGVYDVTLDRGYAKLVHFSGSIIAAANTINTPVLAADYTAASTNLQFKTIATGGSTATEPASGDIILITAEFDELGLM